MWNELQCQLIKWERSSNYLIYVSLSLLMTCGQKKGWSEFNMLSIKVSLGLSLYQRIRHIKLSFKWDGDTFRRVSSGWAKKYIRKSIITADQSNAGLWQTTNPPQLPLSPPLLIFNLCAILNNCKVTGWPSVEGGKRGSWVILWSNPVSDRSWPTFNELTSRPWQQNEWKIRGLWDGDVHQ